MNLPKSRLCRRYDHFWFRGHTTKSLEVVLMAHNIDELDCLKSWASPDEVGNQVVVSNGFMVIVTASDQMAIYAQPSASSDASPRPPLSITSNYIYVSY